MYTAFFGLRCLPFEDRADAQFFLATAECEEALAAMEYEAHSGTGVGLVLGEAGTGKTLLIRTLLLRLQKTDHSVVITRSATGAVDLVRECCKGFGVTLPSSQSDTRRLSRLRRHFARVAASGQRAILIIDQAENLTAANMSELETLNSLQGDNGRLLSVILAGQPRFRTLLEQPEFARLRQLTFGERLLTPFDPAETQAYVAHRLQAAGAGETDLFDAHAVALVHRASGGIPRLINRICNAALLAAYGAGERSVTAAIVNEVTRSSPEKERTVGARDVGVATSDEVAAGWRSSGRPYDPRSIPFSATAGTVADDDPFPADSATDTELMTASYDSGETGWSGPSAGPACETSAVGGAACAAIHGDLDVSRLERTIAQAERLGATTEASLTRFQAVEKHLVSLVDRAERLAGTLGSSVQAGADVDARLHRRLEQIVAEAEQRLQAVESGLAQAGVQTVELTQQAERMEQARARADQAEARLTTFAEQLADRADEVQQQVIMLTNGLPAAEEARARLSEIVASASGAEEEARARLTELIDQAKAVAGEAEGRVESLATKAKACAGEAEHTIRQAVTAETEAGRKRIHERLKASERSAREAAETAHAKLNALVQGADAAVSEVEARIQTLREAMGDEVAACERSSRQAMETMQAKVDRAVEQTDKANQQTAAGAVERCRAALQELGRASEEKFQEAVEAASLKLEAVLREANSVAADGDTRIKASLAMVQGALEEAQKCQQQSAAGVVERCRAALHELAKVSEEKFREAVEAARVKLEAALREANAAAADGDARIKAFLAVVQGATEEAQNRQKQSAAAALERYESTLRERLREFVGSAREAIEVAERKQKGIVDRASGAVGDFERKIDALLVATGNAVEEGRRSAEGFTQTAVESCRGQLQPIIDGAKDEAARIEQQVRSLTECSRLLDSSLAESTKALRPIEDRAAGLQTVLHDAAATVDELSTRAAKAVAPLKSTVERAEGMLVGVQGACGQVEMLQRQTAATLGEVGAACERAAAARAQLAEAEQATARLRGEVAQGRELADKLDKLLTSARERRESLERSASSAARTSTALDAGNETAARLLGELGEAKVALREHLDSLTAATALAETAAASVTAQTERVRVAMTNSKSLAAGLETASADARQLREALETLAVHADQKIGQMTAARAAAGHLLEGIGKANVSAQETVDRVQRSTQVLQEKAADAEQRVERAGDEVQALAARTEATAQQLASNSSRAAELVDKLRAATEPAARINADLGGRVEEAREQIATLTEASGKAGQLVDRLQAITRVLAAAKAVGAALGATIDSGKSLKDEMVALVEEAAVRFDALRDLMTATQSLPDAQSTIDQLSAHLESTRQAIEGGERLLHDFIEQAGAIGKDLGALHNHAVEIERRLAETAVQPTAILESAQAQSAQLERVCVAVRKVFAGLSQATLEARRQTDDLRSTGQEAASRLTRLTTETNRASQTLNQWLEEAVRVQSRLEVVVQDSPPIQQTHPAGTLHGVVQTLTPPLRTTRSTLGVGLTTLPQMESSPPGGGGPIAQPPTRAQEIARLIEEAKRAEGTLAT